MEKVSEADLVKRIKSFVLNENYAGALAVVRGVDTGRMKNPTILCMIGEVYEHEKLYENAEEAFLRAYDRSPKNRKILDRITSLYIEMGEYAEAEYYYKEFISVASRDLHRYILRYRLDKSKGERQSVLIDTLEQLKDYEYMEEWAYELALLYESAGETDKCIRECDEIVLWFGNGEFVDKAIELKCKLTGEPLPQTSTVDMDNEMDDDLRVINPDDAFESEGVDTGIDTAMIAKVVDEQMDFSDVDSDEEFLDEVITEPEVKESDDFFSLAAEFGLTDLVEEDLDDEFEEDLDDDGIFEEDLDDEDDFKDEIIEESLEEIVEEIIDEESELLDEDLDADEIVEEVAEEAELDIQEALEGMTEDQDEVLLEQALFGGIPMTDMHEDNLDEEDEILDAATKSDIFSKEDEDFLAELFSDDNSMAEEMAAEIEKEDAPISQTVKNIFSTVPNVKNVHRQLTMTFSQFETEGVDYDVLAPYDINFVVLSDDMSMKNQIAIGIAKALNTYGMCDKTKIVRAKAGELNRQDFSSIFPKIKGGCLIVERADELTNASSAIIEREVYREDQDVAIILASRQKDMMMYWRRHPELRGKFLNVINVSKYNENELVTLAKGYIEKRGYELSMEAAIVLRDYFKKEIENNEEVGYEQVMTVVDEGIASLDKRNMKNLFMTVLDNKYEEAKMLKLRGDDFAWLAK